MRLPNKFNLYVGINDINNGQECNSWFCPTAIALKRKFDTAQVEICETPDGSEVFAIIRGEHYEICDLGQKWIESFDNSECVKPVKMILTKA